MTAEDANSVMTFCDNHPIKYQRLNNQLRAFGVVGYYLDDERYQYYENILVTEIKNWIKDISSVSTGESILDCLSGIAYRTSQDILCDICCQFFEQHYSRWYSDIFKFIGRSLNLQKMSNDSAERLVEQVCQVMDNEKDRAQIQISKTFLCTMRNQNRALTEELDKKVAEFFPQYYEDIYKLETTENEKEDMVGFVQRYTERIRNSNEKQGKGGSYFGHGTRDIAIVRGIIIREKFWGNDEIMDNLISTVAETILVSKEGINEKLDAISLLISVVIKYPEAYKRNQVVYEELYTSREEIETVDFSIISSNINSVSLKIGLHFLYAVMEKDVYNDILELMPYIENDIATTNAVTRLIVDYLDTADFVILPNKIEAVVLQNALQWIHSENLDIRWNATQILFALARNTENSGIVNRCLAEIVDSDCVYIKNLILRHIDNTTGITAKTKEYIVAKCRNDANYVVRMVCEEVSEGKMNGRRR